VRTAPALSAAAIRALSRDLAERLQASGGRTLRAQPGRLFFPKRTHALTPIEGEAPDGLSADYVALIARLNARSAPSGRADLLAVLLRTVEAEIARARVLETRLIEAMDRLP